MILFRSLLYLAFLVLSTFGYSALIVLLDKMLPGPSRTDRLGHSWAMVNLAALRKLCRLDYRVQGLENLPSGPAVVLAKHQSAWETISLRGILPLNQSWVLKQELMSIPVFGWALKRFQAIPILRSDGRRAIAKLIQEGEKLLAKGRWVLVFPEGTRVAPGMKQKYNAGGALLAERTRTGVVPIAHNAGEFWGPRSLLKYPGTIDVVIGPMIVTENRKAAEINEAAERWIETTVASLPRRQDAARLCNRPS